LERAIAGALDRCAAVAGGVEFGAEQVDGGLGEVGDAAGVVEVEVSEDDMADIGG
jgi:hypothetical protein